MKICSREINSSFCWRLTRTQQQKSIISVYAIQFGPRRDASGVQLRTLEKRTPCWWTLFLLAKISYPDRLAELGVEWRFVLMTIFPRCSLWYCSERNIGTVATHHLWASKFSCPIVNTVLAISQYERANAIEKKIKKGYIFTQSVSF